MENSPNNSIEKYDQVSHFWCPMLGQPMRFGYCRSMHGGLPCHRVLTCFEPHFDVTGFIQENYSQEQQDKFLQPAEGRMETVAQALAGAGKKDAQ